MLEFTKEKTSCISREQAERFSMLRSDESNALERILGCEPIKKKSYFERVNWGYTKKDPFEGKVDNNIWKVQGDKLLRKKSKEEL